MRYFILLGVLLITLMAFPHASPASGLGKLVTKGTQKELDLEFDLSAIHEGEAVVVSMTIPKSGKLKDLRIVALSIHAENQKYYLVRAPLDMKHVDAGIRVSAQLAPELAVKAALDLVVQEGRREFYYAVRVKDYITARNEAEGKDAFDIRAMDGSVLIGAGEIVGYEWATHTLIIKEGTRDRLRKELFAAAKPLTVPFRASLAGKPVYEGQFVSPATSRSSAMVSIVLDIDPRTPNQVRIQRGYAIDETKLIEKDPRMDDRIKESMAATGKLR